MMLIPEPMPEAGHHAGHAKNLAKHYPGIPTESAWEYSRSHIIRGLFPRYVSSGAEKIILEFLEQTKDFRAALMADGKTWEEAARMAVRAFNPEWARGAKGD